MTPEFVAKLNNLRALGEKHVEERQLAAYVLMCEGYIVASPHVAGPIADALTTLALANVLNVHGELSHRWTLWADGRNTIAISPGTREHAAKASGRIIRRFLRIMRPDLRMPGESEYYPLRDRSGSRWHALRGMTPPEG